MVVIGKRKCLMVAITFLFCLTYTNIALAASDVDFGLVDLGEGDTFYRLQIDVDTHNSKATDKVIVVFDEGSASEQIIRTQLVDGKTSRVTDYEFKGDRKFPENVTLVIGSRYYSQKTPVRDFIGDVYKLSVANSLAYDNKFEPTEAVVSSNPSTKTVSPSQNEGVKAKQTDQATNKKQGITLDDSRDINVKRKISLGLTCFLGIVIILLYIRSKKR